MILILIALTSCASGMFEPHDMALHYQTQENDNITVKWRFSSKANVSIPSLKIHCVFVVPELKVFYHLDHSVEEAQHHQFAGRVQCDQDALRRGRVRLLLSRVRTEDSGQYLCRMVTESGKKVKEFSLHVASKPTQAAIEAKSVTPEPKPASRGRTGLYAGLGLAAAAAAGLAACLGSTRCTPHHLRGRRRTQERCAAAHR